MSEQTAIEELIEVYNEKIDLIDKAIIKNPYSGYHAGALDAINGFLLNLDELQAKHKEELKAFEELTDRLHKLANVPSTDEDKKDKFRHGIMTGNMEAYAHAWFELKAIIDKHNQVTKH